MRKENRKEKWMERNLKENKKISLNLINYFYMFIQIYFICFSLIHKN